MARWPAASAPPARSSTAPSHSPASSSASCNLASSFTGYPSHQRGDPELFQHHLGGLQGTFDPALGIRIGFTTDVERALGRWLDDLLLDVLALHTDVPTVPATPEGIISPIAERCVAHLG